VLVVLRAVDKLVFISPLYRKALALVLVDFARHAKAIVEELLGNRALARCRVLKHATKEATLVKLTLFNQLHVEVLFGEVGKGLYLVLRHVRHPRQLHHFLEGLRRILKILRHLQSSPNPVVGLHGLTPVASLLSHVLH